MERLASLLCGCTHNRSTPPTPLHGRSFVGACALMGAKPTAAMPVAATASTDPAPLSCQARGFFEGARHE